MVQKSDNEFVKSRIELHCIVPFANTIIPDSRKKKQPLHTRTFPNLQTITDYGLSAGSEQTVVCVRRAFHCPCSLHLAGHAKSPFTYSMLSSSRLLILFFSRKLLTADFRYLPPKFRVPLKKDSKSEVHGRGNCFIITSNYPKANTKKGPTAK